MTRTLSALFAILVLWATPVLNGKTPYERLREKLVA